MRRHRALLLTAIAPAIVAAGLLLAATSSAGTTHRRSCAPSDRHAPVSTRAGARARLVPAAPAVLLLCRYGGLNDGRSAYRLIATPVLIASPARVARFARELNALAPTTGAYPCPFSSGRAIVATFGYRTGPDDPVTVGLDGCMLVGNGHVRRTAGVQKGGPALVAALTALVPAR